MVNEIVDILSARVGELEWVERRAGLVMAAQKPVQVRGDDGTLLTVGAENWPVACNVTPEGCADVNMLNALCPDSSRVSVLYWQDTAGATFQQTVGPKLKTLEFAFSVRLLAWLNLPKLGIADCAWAARVVPGIIGKLQGSQAGNDIYKNVRVTGITQLAKTPEVFNPFSFVQEGQKKGLFLPPYDYFALQVSGRFTIMPTCIEPPTFTISNPTCKDE